MVLRLAGLPVWSPSDMIAAARAVMGWTDEAIGMVAALPDRVSSLLDDVEVLVVRITEVADRVEAIVGRIDPLLSEVSLVAESAAVLVARADVVAGSASGVIEKVTVVADRAGALVEEAGTTSRTAQELLGVYAPIAGKAAPLAKKFVDELSEAEVQAAIRLIDQLPLFTEHMETDIMPILATLDRVGPDVHELLDVLKDVRQAINGIPGFDYLRRRGEREEATEQRSD